MAENQLTSIRDQIIPVLALLETTKGHLCPRDVFLWVFQVFKLSHPFDAAFCLMRVWSSLPKCPLSM